MSPGLKRRGPAGNRAAADNGNELDGSSPNSSTIPDVQQDFFKISRTPTWTPAAMAKFAAELGAVLTVHDAPGES